MDFRVISCDGCPLSGAATAVLFLVAERVALRRPEPNVPFD
jgi:hypothetical protein